MPDELLLAYVTIPDENAAQTLANNAVEKGLCAGVNIIGPIRSTYRWQGETRSRKEWLLIGQTTRAAWQAFEKFVRESHSDLVPCILGLPIAGACALFHNWILENATRHAPD